MAKPSRAQRKAATVAPPAAQAVPAVQTVEICRSFGYKLNAGNYESRDFFCSYKISAPKTDEAEASQSAYDFCETEVLEAVKNYRNKLKQQRGEAA